MDKQQPGLTRRSFLRRLMVVPPMFGLTVVGGGKLNGFLATLGAGTTATPEATDEILLNCVGSPQETEGPYFVDEMLNRSDIRSDPTDGTIKPGVPLQLAIRVFQVNGSACTPLSGAHVDIWHCDATGLYSDEAANNTVGKKFLRGYQVTDANGAVQFTTIYPGWYQGRTVHIHVKIRTYAPDNHKTYEYTSQLFFDDALSDKVFALAPYNTRPNRDTTNATDGIFLGPSTDGSVAEDSGDEMLLTVTDDGNGGYVGSINIGIDMSRTATDNFGGRGAPPGGGFPGGGNPPGRNVPAATATATPAST